jgi:hypothetical protein
MFEMAGESIEINGIPYREAFQAKKGRLGSFLTSVYEPLDESLRQRVDQAQEELQESILKVSNLRKNFPSQIDMLNQETLRLVTGKTEDALIEEGIRDLIYLDALDEPEVDQMIEVDEIHVDGYDKILLRQAQLSKVFDYFLTITLGIARNATKSQSD